MVLSGYGFVKEVTSGDTLVIIGNPKNGEPPELRLTLASLQAPRFNKTKLEPFAFESREFLRKLCIGQRVFFRVEYSIDSLNRQFGAAHLNTPDSENLCLTVAKSGWASVSQSSSRPGELSGDHDALVSASTQAQASKLGIYGSSTSLTIQDLSKPVSESSLSSFFDNIKAKRQKAVIEYCKDGASFKALLLDSMTLINFNLGGLQCPKKETDFASEARFFSAVRVMHREVFLHLGGVNSKYGTFYGSIHALNGLDLAEELIKHGLAVPVDWSLEFASSDTGFRIHRALHSVREKRVRIWRNYVKPQLDVDSESVLTGEVVEVSSGDMLEIRKESDKYGSTSTVFVSSVRCEKRGETGAYEAKEWMRSKVIGKSVRVEVEYKVDNRIYGTVFLKGENLGEALLLSGYARLSKHKQGAERSHYFHDLIRAEQKAKQLNLNLHNPSFSPSPPPSPITSHSASITYVASLKQPTKAIVDYVLNGSRLKVIVPSQNISITLSLSGISCDRVVKGEKDTVAVRAYSLTKYLVNQREVVIEVLSVDKGGNFIGNLKYEGGKDLAILLVERGLAKTSSIGIRYATNADKLILAENQAKESKIGVWEHYVASEEVVEESSSAVKLSICHIESCNKFFVQMEKDKDKLKQVADELSKYDVNSIAGLSDAEFKHGAVVACKFSDGVFYRAKRVSKTMLKFIDFGNSSEIDFSQLRKIESESVESLSGLCHEASLAHVQAPQLSQEYGKDAAMYLSQLTAGSVVPATVCSRSSENGLILSLETAEEESINCLLLSEGLAVIPSKSRAYPKCQALYEQCEAAQETAHVSHVNLWRYGDPRAEED